MKLARLVRPGRTPMLCQLEDDMAVPIAYAPERIGADPLRDLIAQLSQHGPGAIAAPFPAADATHLSPIAYPTKIICVGLNYVDHAKESGFEPPTSPVIFAKYPNALIGHDAAITWSAETTTQVDYEAELAVVIGRTTRNVSPRHALTHVFGYAACNDVSARDAQFADGQWVRGKTFDTFLPLGPIVTSDEVPDPQALAITCTLNGETMQQAPTSDMIFPVAELVSYLSRFMTLMPGDLIATGTPPGVGFSRNPPVYLCQGDVLEVNITTLPTLRNRCHATDGS